MPLFFALGDRTRLELLQRLAADGPLPVARLAEGAAVSRQSLRKHLTVLEDAGLVTGTASGRELLWDLRPGGLEDLRSQLSLISQQWDSAIGRLKLHLGE